MTIGTETAEGYCVADSVAESKEYLERAMEGTAIPSVEDSPPRVFLEEMLETPAGLILVVEQEPDDPAYGEVETFPVVDNFPPLVAVPSHYHEQPANKQKGSKKGTPKRAPKIQRLRNTIQESREQFAELQAGQTEIKKVASSMEEEVRPHLPLVKMLDYEHVSLRF
uniref:Uncharacterized protein n=1 Tax=Timema douglasi TaxID=61478 RepID=A0A7R8ZE42_TIMDO|nr:unnamed protein product [Timema douglasi]